MCCTFGTQGEIRPDARRAGSLRVREMIEQKKQSDPEKNHQSHFHPRLPVHLWNKVGCGNVNGHSSGQRKPGSHVMPEKRHGENTSQRGRSQ